MKTNKRKPVEDEALIQEKTEIWKQVIITVGVVIVALIGAWQAVAIVQFNNKSASPAPTAIPPPATITPLPLQATNTSQPANPVEVVAATQPLTATNTSQAKSFDLSPVNVDFSKWYRLTNESLGKNFSLDHWADTKDIVMNPTAYFSGQYWGFKESVPGYYTLASEFFGLDVSLSIQTDNNNSLNLSSSKDNLKGQYWRVTSFNDGSCIRFTSQGLGDSLSLDLTTGTNPPTPTMAQTSEATTQCWHLIPVGTLK